MRALVLSGIRAVTLRDLPEPVPDSDQAVVAVEACGICGSDVHGFLGEEPRRQPGLILGHELVGRIVVPGPSELPVGARVAVNPLMGCGHCPACAAGRTQNCPTRRLLGLDQVPGAFAEQTAVLARNLYPLSDAVPAEVGCLTEPLACAVHLLAWADTAPLASCVIFGAGTLGAMALVVAKRMGFSPLAVVEPSAGRRRIALALGADVAVDPTGLDASGLLDRIGEVELAVDCVGAGPVRQAAAELVEPGGTVLLLGTNDAVSSLDFRSLVRREVRLQASYGFTAADFARALTLIEAGALPVAEYCRSLPLSAGQAAFEAMLPAPEDVIKLVLRPD